MELGTLQSGTEVKVESYQQMVELVGASTQGESHSFDVSAMQEKLARIRQWGGAFAEVDFSSDVKAVCGTAEMLA